MSAQYSAFEGDPLPGAFALRHSSELNHRGILRGVQCVCGQWWPDFVRTESAMQFRTECCGALYQYTTGLGAQTTLSLISAEVARTEGAKDL